MQYEDLQLRYMKEVSLEIDRSERVETDLKRMGYRSEMLPLAFCSHELLCHAPIV